MSNFNSGVTIYVEPTVSYLYEKTRCFLTIKMKNLALLICISFLSIGCTRMTIPVNVLPFLLIQETQVQQAQQASIAMVKQENERLYTHLPQQQLLPIEPSNEIVMN